MKSDRKDENENPRDQPEDVDGEQKDSGREEDEPAAKRGEGSNNLRRRSEWFQKRHGGG